MLAIAEPLGEGERIADAHFMSFLQLSELGRIHEARGALRDPRAGDRGAPSARPGLARARQPLGARAARGRLRGRPRRRSPARPGRSTGSRRGATRSPPRGCTASSCGASRAACAEEEATVRQSVVDFPWYPMFRSVLVCLLLDLGEVAEARTEFEELAAGEFAALYRDNSWLFGISLAAEACARLGDAPAAAVLLEQLAPFAGRHAIAHAEGSVGRVDRYLGLLARDPRSPRRGRTPSDGRDRASTSRMGARPWVAHCQHDLAEVLRRRGRAGDAAAADALDRQALATARALGMALAARDRASPRHRRTPRRARSRPVGRVPPRGRVLDDRVRTRRVPGPRLARHAPPGSAAPGARHGSPRAGAGCTALAGGRRPPRRSSRPDVAMAGSDGAGPTLDAEAKAAYRARLVDLREELAEAEAWHDPERVARLEAEQDALAHELGAALGLGGRDRPSGTPSERARISATRAIRAAMARIAEQSPALGAHLEATIRTGTYCAYVPDPRAPIAWRL